MDYKERLRRKASNLLSREGERKEKDAEGRAPSELCTFVQNLAGDTESQRVVFQSVAVTAMQLLHRVRECIEAAGEAGLSLGQRERLAEMKVILMQLTQVLDEGLSVQGKQMLDLSEVEEEPTVDETNSWWFALTEAIELLEDGEQQMASLAQGQPEGSPARQLCECIANLFHEQHRELLIEADRWIS